MISGGFSNAYLEYAFFGCNGLVMASFFERSNASVRSVAASLNGDLSISINNRQVQKYGQYNAYVAPVTVGKEKFYHCLAVTDQINKKVLMTTSSNATSDFFSFLMENYDLPLMEEWKDVLFERAMQENYVKELLYRRVVKGKFAPDDLKVILGDEEVAIDDIHIYDIELSVENLHKLVSSCLKYGYIKISSKPMHKLEISTMDEYFNNYGNRLVENLENHIEPLVPLSGNCDSLVLNKMKLFPQQAANVNGIIKLLDTSSYGILNMGCGTGKTICGASIVEGYFNTLYQRKHPNATLKDIYSNPENISYRVIVMPPGHLVEKWASEIRKQVPFAKVTILSELSQLIEIRERGKERNGKEWFILGKDFAKLSYYSIPVPEGVGYRAMRYRTCKKCGTSNYSWKQREFKCRCGCSEYEIGEDPGYRVYGMICPECNSVLMPNVKIRVEKTEDDTKPLLPRDFANPNSRNEFCGICGTSLWRPHVRNINTPGTDFFEHALRSSKWKRVKHFKNNTHKATMSAWVHKDFEKEYFQSIGQEKLDEMPEDSRGVRRVAPASYIKKYLKGYFDMAVIDEAHTCKGGSTAQGNAMAALLAASKKKLALTGTLAGGKASDLFYLLFRLDSHRMLSHGFGYHSLRDWIARYGKLERRTVIYDGDDDMKTSSYNQTSKGRQNSQPQEKPGISPLIYSHFLLDKTVFLDLSEMSRFLPEFNEIVETVEIPECVEDADGNSVANREKEMYWHYQHIIDVLKKAGRKGGGEGRGILGKMLQFSLSYIDKPYGVEPIISPFSGSLIARPDDYSDLVADGKLLAKERKLVEIISEELSQKRNCVVYAEYTSTSAARITDRLREIIMRECNLRENEVVIIESSRPSAREREAWMHKKAKEGARVFITNPRNVETGLDFKWEEDGRTYNYQTLIFYQLGYSLYTVIQASRRSYRLNQDQPCKVYYLAVKGSVQEVVIKLIAEKNLATSAISGHFSTSGLNALANGCDAKLELAKALSDMDEYHCDELQELFDALHSDDTDLSRYGDYHPMLTFSELMGTEAAEKEKVAESNAFVEMMNFFDNMFEMPGEVIYTTGHMHEAPAKTLTPDKVDEVLERAEKKQKRAEKRREKMLKRNEELCQFSLF